MPISKSGVKVVSFSNLIQLGSLSERIEDTQDTKIFLGETIKEKNLANFLRIVSSLIQYHKMEKPKDKKSFAALSLSPLANSSSLSYCAHERVSECVQMREGASLFIFFS